MQYNYCSQCGKYLTPAQAGKTRLFELYNPKCSTCGGAAYYSGWMFIAVGLLGFLFGSIILNGTVNRIGEAFGLACGVIGAMRIWHQLVLEHRREQD